MPLEAVARAGAAWEKNWGAGARKKLAGSPALDFLFYILKIYGTEKGKRGVTHSWLTTILIHNNFKLKMDEFFLS